MNLPCLATDSSKCPICESMQDTDVQYVCQVLTATSRRESNGHAIAEAFGFCNAHAHTIIAEGARLEPNQVRNATAALRSAAVSALELLDLESNAEDHVLGLLFRVREACPACQYARRHLSASLSRHVQQLHERIRRNAPCPPICVPHFRTLVAKAQQADLRPWIEAQAESLADSRRSARLIHWLAGSPGDASATSEAAGGLPGPEETAQPGGSCPVCKAVQAAHAHWLEGAKAGARLELTEWAALPDCPEHLWDCVRSGDAALAARAEEHALDTALVTLRDAIAWLDREDRRLEAESKSVWHRPRSPAYLLGQRRKTLRALWRCDTCERLEVATQGAVGELCETLQSHRGRQIYEYGEGLCMKHFAEARLIVPAGLPRQTLVDVQAARLRTLERALAVPRNPPWLEAVTRFSAAGTT